MVITTALFNASNHVKSKLKERGSHGREGNRKDHTKFRGDMKVPNVEALINSIGSLFHETGSLAEKAAFLQSKR